MIDTVEIDVCAGDGGGGAVSFRREKGVPKGGPNGGNGGRGGSVFLWGDPTLATLRSLTTGKAYRGERGENGRGKDQHGKSGKDLSIAVPVGCVAWGLDEPDGNQFIGEVVEPAAKLLVAKGGQGGRGNATYATASQQTPYIAEKGEKGERYKLRLELRLIADVGIVGKPNAGKSTLLRASSGARPKIGAYPFTTTEPILGVAEVGWTSYIVTEIPGLLEGAHLGVGLGHEFLRHATRTRVLIHLVDGSAEDVSKDVRDINEELEAYGKGLEKKPRILVVNKIDIPEVKAKELEIKEALAWTRNPLLFTSAAAGDGVRAVVDLAAEVLKDAPEPDRLGPMPNRVTARLGKPRMGTTVRREGGVLVVRDDRVERLVAGSDLRRWAGRAQLKMKLDSLGVTDALEDAGVEHGQTIRFGDVELEW